jgi:mRNA-degrading endonuclease toxin of MazEF toxin-antitoxin module
MKIKRWSVYLVDLRPGQGKKPGKIRPCISIRPDHFNALPSTVILPLTTRLVEKVEEYHPLRIRIPAGVAGLLETSDLLIDQIMAWDNKNFLHEVGELPDAIIMDVSEALREFMDVRA